VAFNGVTFIPTFLKVKPLVEKLKGGTHRQHEHLISLVTFLKEGKEVRNLAMMHLSKTFRNEAGVVLKLQI
jgi:hypothetical protein